MLKIKTRYTAIRSASALALAIAAATPSFAQDAAQPHAPASDAVHGAEQVGDIVVTANKRQENISKVGMTVTALSATVLAERQITSLADLAASVPGLAYGQSTTNTPIFTLRGVGFNESSLGVYPAVSVYIDQAPLPFPVMASHAAFDLERVEVLKGPQGTLFGQNATGGAINYIAAKPTDFWSGGASLGYGRFNQLDGEAHVGGPVTSNMNFRLAVTGLHADAWQRSYTRDDTLGKQSYVAGRFLLDFRPTETVKLSLNVNGWKDTSDPQALQLVAVRPQTPSTINSAELNYPFPPRDPRAADWTNGSSPTGANEGLSLKPFSDRKFFQAALRADVELSSDITLTSMTSYDYFKQTQTTDGDGMALIEFDLARNDGYIRSFNQEVRLANSSHSRFRWILGGNYEKSHTFENQDLAYGDASNSNAANLFFNNAAVSNKQDITNYAVFGNVEYDVLPKLTLKAAARYTNTDNHARICGYSPGDGQTAALFNFLGTILGQVPFTPIGQNGCFTLNNQFVPGDPYIKQLKQNNISWRVGVDYRLRDNLLLYANASRGFKAGSFPSLAAANFTGLTPVVQEQLTAYETGVKAQLFDRHVSLNAAAFYYDYKDHQIRGKLHDDIFGILDALINVPKSRVMGLDADISVRPVTGLTLSGAVTYLDSKIERYSGVNIIGLTENFAGVRLPFTPKWAGSVDAEYRMSTSGGGTPFVGATVRAQSGSDAAVDGAGIDYPAAATTKLAPGVTHPYAMPGYAVVDARLGYESKNSNWKVMVWGKNIFNKYYIVSVVPTSDADARLTGRPASYGVKLSYNF